MIYRPPKYDTDFINDFSDFLSGIMLNYDRILIIGNFNNNVCCPTKPLVKDFLHLIDSFNLVQSVIGSTHKRGHTLDLVLSCGLPVSNLEISKVFFSDHIPVLFDIFYSLFFYLIHPLLLSSLFQNSSETYFTFPSCFNSEELTSLFNFTC